jgi:GT2 family glycosyltransferase
MYAEDLDLCIKARNIGLKNYYVPTAEIVHHGGGSSCQSRGSFSDVMMRESLVRLLRKTRSPAYAVAFRIAMGCNAACRLLLLAASSPLAAPMRFAPRIRTGLKKWSAILRWALGLEAWVFQYGSKIIK